MRISGVLLAAIAAVAMFAGGAYAQAPQVEGAEQESAETEGPGAEGDAGGPAVVRVGALINDIQQLDLTTHSYTADIYIWFKWDDPEIDPSRTFEFLNPFELWGHIRKYSGVK